MNKNTQASMLDLQTNLLAGLFILFILVAIKVGAGGSLDTQNSKGEGGTQYSDVVYEILRKRKKDPAVTHVYIEGTE